MALPPAAPPPRYSPRPPPPHTRRGRRQQGGVCGGAGASLSFCCVVTNCPPANPQRGVVTPPLPVNYAVMAAETALPGPPHTRQASYPGGA